MFRYIYWFKRRIPQRYKPTVLITGCGSGIGLAAAELFYNQKQYRVLITSRKKSIPMLQSRFPEDERFMIRELDVNNAEQRIKVVEDALSKWGSIDILINNAGISYRSVVEHMTDEDEMLQMSTNYFSPMSLIKLVLPKMKLKGRGKIINVSSVSGMLAMPTMSSYSASKYAIEGASEALWYEARAFGVDVCLIQPGFIHSDSFQNVYYSKEAKKQELEGGEYEDFYRNMTPFVQKLMKLSWATPQSIAKLMLDVVQTSRPPLWIPATLDAELFYYLRRLLPRRLLHPFLFFCLPHANKWAARFTKKRD